MSETEKTMVFLGMGGGIAMLLGAFILSLQNHTIHGDQFYTDWNGNGSHRVIEGSLSWQGLVFLGLICIGMGTVFLLKKKKEVWKD